MCKMQNMSEYKEYGNSAETEQLMQKHLPWLADQLVGSSRSQTG